MNISISNHKIADLLILIVLFSLVSWYAYDAYSASSHIVNLILILPVTAIVLVLCTVEFLSTLTAKALVEPEREAVASVLPVISLFVGYVLTLSWLGFDVGTFIFISLFMWLHGERRLVWVLGYSIAFATSISLFFAAMLPYPMPMLILSTAY